MRRPPIFELWRVALFLMIVPAGWLYVWVLSPAPDAPTWMAGPVMVDVEGFHGSALNAGRRLGIELQPVGQD